MHFTPEGTTVRYFSSICAKFLDYECQIIQLSIECSDVLTLPVPTYKKYLPYQVGALQISHYKLLYWRSMRYNLDWLRCYNRLRVVLRIPACSRTVPTQTNCQQKELLRGAGFAEKNASLYCCVQISQLKEGAFLGGELCMRYRTNLYGMRNKSYAHTAK